MSKLKEIRKKNKLPIWKVKQLTGICESSISLISNGKKDFMVNTTLKRFCKLYNCTPNDLIEWSEEFVSKSKK